jgi:glycerate dehydrogenase
MGGIALLKKIVVLDGFSLNPGDLSWEPFKGLADELAIYDRTEPSQAPARIEGAEAVLTNKTPLKAEAILSSPSLRYIGVLATGYNIVDVEAARSKNVAVTNIPAYGTAAVAQFAIALLLEICHRIGHHAQSVKKGGWNQAPDWCYWDHPLIELAGKTMGIIGFGRIGQATGAIAKAMGMDIVAHSPRQSPAGLALARYVGLDELLAVSHVISLHCPLNQETRHIINRETISKMRDGVIIINNSRGPLISEEALGQALISGKVQAAGLDVSEIEPIKPDNPLLALSNCLITPHISWAPKESRQCLMSGAAENLKAFLEGKPLNLV